MTKLIDGTELVAWPVIPRDGSAHFVYFERETCDGEQQTYLMVPYPDSDGYYFGESDHPTKVTLIPFGPAKPDAIEAASKFTASSPEEVLRNRVFTGICDCKHCRQFAN